MGKLPESRNRINFTDNYFPFTDWIEVCSDWTEVYVVHQYSLQILNLSLFAKPVPLMMIFFCFFLNVHALNVRFCFLHFLFLTGVRLWQIHLKKCFEVCWQAIWITFFIIQIKIFRWSLYLTCITSVCFNYHLLVQKLFSSWRILP